MLRVSEMDMFESVVSESDASEVIVPMNFDSVMLRVSEMYISLFRLIE